MNLLRRRFQTNESFRLLVDAVNDYAIFMLNPSGHVVTWNAGAQKMKGYGADEVLGRHVSIFHAREDIAAGEPGALLARAAAYGRAENEGIRIRRDGSQFWANVVITAIRDKSGALRGFAKVTQDLTERRRVAELEAVSRLAARIQAAREEEQIRIAHELHDDLGQQLTALKMSLAELEHGLRDRGSLDAGIQSGVTDMARVIDDTVASLRRIATGLRPIALETLGLASALEWLIDDFTQRYGIAVATSLPNPPLNLHEAAESALFHMVQEALTNVARHAQADRVSVELSRQSGQGKGRCVLRIVDNGRGAAPVELAGETSFGLVGMRERARGLNGTVQIDTAPGGGFSVMVSLPLEAIEPSDTSGD
ncbi:PAS domain-containing sensor histidine kinase [Paraburkholderia sp. BCC1876]|uniref:PAS domain-containing sensor histidine kinase n=1 Tax=Paraburkholderia sp. BCC1876 TaxID=2676303 RepID=UPI00158FC9E2|nr:PAS domain-containing sensor histidine kinase [Paraburkholderia sp. BCC1876]